MDMGLPSYRSPSPMNRRRPRAYTCLYVAIAVVLFFAVFVYTPLPNGFDDHRGAIVAHLKNATIDTIPIEIGANSSELAQQAPATLENPKSKYAYATFLASPTDPDKKGDMEHDNYFVATRILAYQLLHAPETRSEGGYPFVVLVTSDVSEGKRDRLRRDGAIVWEAEPLDAGWITTEVSTWQKVMSKLRLWELTQFERICFVDGDTVLAKSLDGIFEDPAVVEGDTDTKANAVQNDEEVLPLSYVFAATPEMEHKHSYPPKERNHDWPNINYLNAGFFVLQPSHVLMQYYLSLTTVADRFDPHLPEQNLLNYAHRRDGNMPWRQLNTTWNIHYPSMGDLEGGVASLHDKWWWPVNDDLKPYMLRWRWRMEGFWEARDAIRA